MARILRTAHILRIARSAQPALLVLLAVGMAQPFHALAQGTGEVWDVPPEAARCVLDHIEDYRSQDRDPLVIRPAECRSGNVGPGMASAEASGAVERAGGTGAVGDETFVSAAGAINDAILGGAPSTSAPADAARTEMLPAIRRAKDAPAWAGGQAGAVVVYTKADLDCLAALRDRGETRLLKRPCDVPG